MIKDGLLVTTDADVIVEEDVFYVLGKQLFV